MSATRTYRPPLPKIPAGDDFRADPCGLRNPDPCPHTYGVRYCPCGPFATDPCRPTACIPAAPFRHTPYRFRPRRTATVWRNLQQHPHTPSSHTFSAKERDTETGLSYFGARYYSSDLSIWLSVDPMSDKYPSFSPYVYCANNPVRLVDPNGEDPIYAKNFWGNVKKIGDDGRCGSGSYLVRGRTARDVKSATKAGEFYTNDLSASNEVFHIPTGKKQKDVQTTVQNTINSGDSPDTRVEYGGHSIKGEENARLWDPGIPTQTYKTPDGYTVNERSITPFRINGVNNRFGGPPEAFEYIWHVHTFSSTPSSHDFFVMRNDWSRWFKGTIFIVCPNDNKVAFYNQSKVLIRVTYDEFKKMGKQEDIP